MSCHAYSRPGRPTRSCSGPSLGPSPSGQDYVRSVGRAALPVVGAADPAGASRWGTPPARHDWQYRTLIGPRPPCGCVDRGTRGAHRHTGHPCDREQQLTGQGPGEARAPALDAELHLASLSRAPRHDRPDIPDPRSIPATTEERRTHSTSTDGRHHGTGCFRCWTTTCQSSGCPGWSACKLAARSRIARACRAKCRHRSSGPHPSKRHAGSSLRRPKGRQRGVPVLVAQVRGGQPMEHDAQDAP